ncbi:hypothetical protein [Ilumatobacter coccineus]|uniref:Uncharacterized protein n=1 Tax=Ilumatobacter coccineus (strain NBRC 103263 / KCTC 29153 / YM16-304) TaxID=1313172 RepID=A0A6C7E070_ILUCY|nr:hypothetical protein [Ilumatobacter coccineus]BAN00737.1 hypothetical protein YM304_04230 [Ilumatobacter coccineus YM16-304]
MTNDAKNNHEVPLPDSASNAGLSRRSVLGAAAVLSGASLAALARGEAVSAGPAALHHAVSPPVDGLSYITLDAFAFHVADTASTTYRLYQELTGMQPQPAPNYLDAPLTIPIGSSVRQLNIGYQGTPVISIARRTLTGTIANVTTPTTLDGGGGAKTQTLDVDALLEHDGTYTVRAFCSVGDSVYGMTVGYAPPAAMAAEPTPAYVPYTGADPRALDTRTTGKIGPNAEVVVDLSSYVEAAATAAVINVTAVQVTGRGYLAVFRDGIEWPGNASVNSTEPGQDVGNNVITAMQDGKIRIRTGPISSHIVVDVVGSLL